VMTVMGRSRGVLVCREKHKTPAMRSYGLMVSVVIHVLLLSLPLCATVTRLSAQSSGGMVMSMIEAGPEPAVTVNERERAGDGDATVTAGAAEDASAQGEETTVAAAEPVQELRSEEGTMPAYSEPGRVSVPEATNAVKAAVENGETRDVEELESGGDPAMPPQDIMTARADDGEPRRTDAEAPQLGPDTVKFGSAGGPAFVKRVLPEYPWMARKAGREGRVLLRLTIDERGRLTDVVVVEKAGYGFDREAVRAVRRSTFRPAVRDGVPVRSEALLYVRFELEEPE